ncbi:MAG: thioredoxin [Caldilineaceae bacterium]
MPIASVIHTNQQSIDRVIQTGLPVILGFWAHNHPFDAQTEALLNQLAEQFAGKALVAKINADDEQTLVQRFHIQQTPALVFTKQGKPETTLMGVIQSRDVQAWLHYLVNGGMRPSEPTRPTPATAPASSASDKPITLTDANFQQIIHGPEPVLVDFWAPWCGPCRMVAPAIEQVAKSFKGRAVVGKLNVDENPQTAQRYRIMSIPALYIFKHGQVVDQLVGAQPAAVLQQRLAQHVNG